MPFDVGLFPQIRDAFISARISESLGRIAHLSGKACRSLPFLLGSSNLDEMFDTTQESYKRLRSICAERTSPIVAWVGSGLSVPAGLPDWKGLRDRLETTLASKARSLSPADCNLLEAKLLAARREINPWIAFGMLEEGLGNTSFQDTVRDSLAPADRAIIPRTYLNLWKLPISGLLNLNLDRLATRAFSQMRGGVGLNEFTGWQAGSHSHLLRSTHDFLVNLHGVASDAQSWVFTKKQMKALLNNRGYREFITSCATSRTIIFFGVTADDRSVGGQLRELLDSGIDLGAHFWITTRTDLATDKWAENSGIRVIRYVANNGDHSNLDYLFDDLLGYLPTEDTPAPVITSNPPVASSPLQDPDKLAKDDEEWIRTVLNAEAAKILEPKTEKAYQEYEQFLKRYDRAIYRAWYHSTTPPHNTLMGYRLLDVIGEGAFGRVYRAQDKRGDHVALKLLHEEVRKNRDMLESFRRGVRSMRILSERQVEGMVPYREASEIPAFAVMDIIDGPNLKQAVESHSIKEWHSVLGVSLELAKIIRKAHNLPERVLHRDIRPSNIMLRGLWTDQTELDVVVLDFDLSWHRDSVERSITQPASVTGYIAPELLYSVQGVSTRNSGVDSFGLGMTLYYTATGLTPEVGQQNKADWLDHLIASVSARKCKEWRSLPLRVARLIARATRHRQNERWDMGQIERELERLCEAIKAPDKVASAELWTEELLIRSQIVKNYNWSEDKLGTRFRLASGAEVTISANEVGDFVKVELSWQQTGDQDRKRVGRWIVDASMRCVAKLNKSGWAAASPSANAQSTYISATITTDQLRKGGDRAALGLQEGVDELIFT
jgi:eukaryotic-like serine/threonine-protein kinase